MNIAELFRDNLRADPAAPAMEFEGRWWTYAPFIDFSDRLETLLGERGVPSDAAIGVVARNRPSHVAAIQSLIALGRPVSMVYAFQAPAALAADIVATGLGFVFVDRQDWSDELAAALSSAGAIALLLDRDPDAGFAIVEPKGSGGATADPRRLPGPGIEILSSGTTGAPKRIFHGVDMLFRSLESSFQSAVPDTSPVPVFWPLGGIGGNLQLAGAILERRPVLLLEKFTVPGIVDAIRRHRLASVAFTPTMLRMIHDAEVPPEDLASLTAFFGGSGPLDPALQDQIEERYGKPVIWALGATEFCGTAIAWTLDLHARFAREKRGSAGKALPGCHVRIAHPETGEVLPNGAIGRMEVRVDRMGPEWIRTTDLALVDDDGFIFHHGRADGAIIRGGFKIVPEKVCEALRTHPGVAEAAVLGVADVRLGQVPVAVIERRPDAGAVEPASLERHLRAKLAAPQIPVRFIIVDRLPYTASLKVNLEAVRSLVDTHPAGA